MNSNGFSVADMSTAAANGHRDGYQAGYADAVKAFDAAQPAAAQEAVAVWTVTREGDPTFPRAYFSEAAADAMVAHITLAPFAVKRAPVAAAPVDDVQLELIGRRHFNGPAPQAWYAAARELLASTPAAPGIDPADPWRGLYAPELMPKLDGLYAYHVAHPDLPSWPKDEDEERGIAPLVKAQGFELEAVFGEYPEDDDEDPDYCAWLAQWQPTPPTGGHWRLVCIQDTEDGPAAFYVRPFAQIDASPKGGNDEANIPAPHRECYSDDGGDSWYEHPADAELVYGLKVGDTYTLIVSHCSVERTYRVTKAPDEASDDYEVEPVQATGAEVGE